MSRPEIILGAQLPNINVRSPLDMYQNALAIRQAQQGLESNALALEAQRNALTPEAMAAAAALQDLERKGLETDIRAKEEGIRLRGEELALSGRRQTQAEGELAAEQQSQIVPRLLETIHMMRVVPVERRLAFLRNRMADTDLDEQLFPDDLEMHDAALDEAIGALSAQTAAARPGTPSYYTDAQGNRRAVVPQPGGGFDQTVLGPVLQNTPAERATTRGDLTVEQADLETQRLIAEGMDPDAARLQAIHTALTTTGSGYQRFDEVVDAEGNISYISPFPRSGEGPQVAAAPAGLRSPLASGERTSLATGTGLLEDLRDLRRLAEQNPQAIGIAQGLPTRIRMAVTGGGGGLPFGEGGSSDADVARLHFLVDSLPDRLEEARDQGDLPGPEYSRMRGYLPGTSSSETKFFSNIDSMISELEGLQARRSGAAPLTGTPQLPQPSEAGQVADDAVLRAYRNAFGSIEEAAAAMRAAGWQ